MHLTVYRQGELFYYAFLYGIALGIYYDFYRFLRHLGFKSKYAVIAQDIIFMCTAAVLCFLFAEVTVNGHIRAFVIIGHLFGIVSYRFSFGLLSGFVFNIISVICKFINRIIRGAVKGLFSVIENIFYNIVSFYRRITSSFVKKTAKRKNITLF